MSDDGLTSDVPAPAAPPPFRRPLDVFGAGPEEEGISPLGLLSLMLRRWRIVFGVPLLSAGLATLYSFTATPTFTATNTFVPEVRSQNRLPSALAGLAGQMGLSLGVEATQSPRFYAEVVRSRELMERVLQTRYPDPRATRTPIDSATLLEILGRGGRGLSDSLFLGMKELGQHVAVRVDNQTSIVRLSVESPYPGLAAAVANRFVEYLNEFNAKNRQSQGRTRRAFVEARIVDVERDLRLAEQDLRTFYERNRSWQQSPQLVFEEGRLRRQVDVVREVYLTLQREYEVARIEEVNDTPAITVIDQAVPPLERSAPKRTFLFLLAIVLGGTLGVFWAGAADYFHRVRDENEGEYREFRGLVQRALREITQPFRATREKRRTP